ncbi:MAG: hypothetical protein K0R50_62 [Eubacterium sp.]|nr:hypothetical protein [Eubacterium sp.]
MSTVFCKFRVFVYIWKTTIRARLEDVHFEYLFHKSLDILYNYISLKQTNIVRNTSNICTYYFISTTFPPMLTSFTSSTLMAQVIDIYGLWCCYFNEYIEIYFEAHQKTKLSTVNILSPGGISIKLLFYGVKFKMKEDAYDVLLADNTYYCLFLLQKSIYLSPQILRLFRTSEKSLPQILRLFRTSEKSLPISLSSYSTFGGIWA